MKRGGPLRRTSKGLDPKLRALVFARDGGCTARGFMDKPCWGPLDPHHLLPKGRGGQDEADNLATVCRAHHDLIDRYPLQAKALDLLR